MLANDFPPPRHYTLSMASPPKTEQKAVNILVLDQEGASANALRQVLDSEGWRVRIVSQGKQLLNELKTGEWSLVIADIGLLGLDSPGYLTLRELSAVGVEDGGRLRGLFLVPEISASQFVGTLEKARQPYVVRPYHLHDFLEKVSDLLVEVRAIEAPLRQVRYEFGKLRKKKRDSNRTNSMFASRDSYSYSEEELAEYEKVEAEQSRTNRAKPRTNLGDSRR